MQFLAVAIGGICGSLLRFGLDRILSIGFDSPAWYATILCNLIGCFVLGTWIGSLVKRKVREWLHVGVSVGVLGSFTTMSTFSVDLLSLIESKQIIVAVGYFFISSVGGLLLAFLGYYLGQSYTMGRAKQ